MESLDWMKKAINSIFDPEKKNIEKEKIFKEKVEPLLKEMLNICKENNFAAIVVLEFGKEQVMAITDIEKNPIQRVIFNIFNLFEKSTIKNIEEKNFKECFNNTLTSIKNLLSHFVKLHEEA